MDRREEEKDRGKERDRRQGGCTLMDFQHRMYTSFNCFIFVVTIFAFLHFTVVSVLDFRFFPSILYVVFSVLSVNIVMMLRCFVCFFSDIRV